MTIPICVAAAVREMVGEADTFVSLASGWNAFASPKSKTFTVPSPRTLMFAGLRSRWITPASCAASNARAICFAIARGAFPISRSSV